MIKAYEFSDNRLKPLENFEASVAGQPWPVWIDVISPTPEEDRSVETLLSISLPTREEMTQIEVSERLYQDDGAEFMTLTAIASIETEDPEMTPVTFVHKGNTVVTLRYAELKAFTNYTTRAQKPGAAPCSGGEQITMALIEALCARMADALESVGTRIDAISRKIFRRKQDEKASSSSQELQSIIEKIGRDGDLLTKIRESLVSINRVLTYHQTLDGDDKRKAREARSRAKVLYRDVTALTDQATFLSNKINFLLDATLGLINLQQNQIIKIFSVAAVVFLPPTLVASIYGMNFEVMPELKWQMGYLWAIGVMILSAIVPYAYFKQRGWL